MKYKSIWLFRFTSYSYCQGTKDKFQNDMRLIIVTLPCHQNEAEGYLQRELDSIGIEYDSSSIESLTINITNS